MPAVASVIDLSKIYRKPGTTVEVAALRSVSIDFKEGEFTAIMGSSGSGKSTLMNILGCLDRPTSGRYILGDIDASQLPDDELSEIRSRRIGFVFQNFNLIQQLTVVENLEVPLFYQGVSPAERRERSIAMASRVGLEKRLFHRPTELSGGQQQRVCIARSLITNPLLLMADEPTGNLDTKTGQTILELFDELVAAGKTIIMVTHDPSIARRCHRVIHLQDGSILEDMRGGRDLKNATLAAH